MKKYLLPLVALCLATPALADTQKIATNGDWTAYTSKEGSANVCFMASKPTATEGLSATAKRGDTFAMVTHRSDEPTPYVFSFQTGYTYKPGTSVTVQIDTHTFNLFTHEDTAWASDAETDAKIVAAIKSGKKMTVTGTSSRGTTTTDTISLKGTGASMQAIAKACRVGG